MRLSVAIWALYFVSLCQSYHFKLRSLLQCTGTDQVLLQSYASKTDATLPNVLNTEQPNDPHNAKSEKRIANFIIVTGLAEADKQIQIQTLEVRQSI